VKWPPAWELVSCNKGSWKGAAVQKELEQESRGIAMLEAVTRKRLVKTLQAVKDLACALVIYKVWIVL
jgi:hypothetical protein